MDFYGFYTGKIVDAYEYLGCHKDGSDTIFRTFAPAAEAVSLIAESTSWQEVPMYKIYNGHFWECRLSGAHEGEMYKYRIHRRDGLAIDHADPYGFAMEQPPQSASIIRSLDTFTWTDQVWMKKRTDGRERAVNIYEVHLGSWRKKEDDSWYTYRELAQPLVTYVKEMGYNYIEVMPLAEHPSDNSWGYQQTGFYSPTARYGTPDDLRYLINYAHQHEVGVILDFVPVHFAVDGYALTEYDGTCLYEYPHMDVGMSEWGSKNFNHSRGEVQSFLQSNALYWIKEFHFDGLRIDALSNIIYWQGNQQRGVNVGAVEFIRHMNRCLKAYDPSVMLIAEDSTSYEGVTRPADQGGLGFDYKWDMGWMNDTLNYFRTAPEYRSRDYHKLTFSMMYFRDANYLLPLSHDEVVHGKATILQKMYGEYEGKFPQARAMYMYMYTHPGKKLNFMGNEFGQFREWDEKREQDWMLKDYPAHEAFAVYMQELSRFYLDHPALSAWDYREEGFQWVTCHEEDRCVYAYERKCQTQRLLCVFNFSDQEQTVELHMDQAQTICPLMTTVDVRYGGSSECLETPEKQITDRALKLSLHPYSGEIYEIR